MAMGPKKDILAGWAKAARNTVIPENILEHYIASVVSGKDPSTAKQYFDKMAVKPGNKLTWLDDSQGQSRRRLSRRRTR